MRHFVFDQDNCPQITLMTLMAQSLSVTSVTPASARAGYLRIVPGNETLKYA
jgi:hypothetical protein